MHYTAAIIVLILILVLFVIVRGVDAEPMTRIRRTVGTANEANEIQVAAGVVNSVPIMDYTHTYWDGAKETSCDECPNGIVCRECPQFRQTFGQSKQSILTDIDNAGNNGNTDNVTIEGFEPGQEIEGSDLLPVHDLDSGFVASRERMGACTTKQYTGNGAAGYITRNDKFTTSANNFDGIFALGRNACKYSSPATKLLYTETLGLTNPDPATADCEFYGHNAYLYKEQC